MKSRTTRPQRPLATTPRDQSSHRAASFPVVGIGASADGMKAVTALLQKPPADNCMSFVQVRQLDEANAGLERCLHRHADLYILAPKGCIILDAKGCIREINGKN